MIVSGILGFMMILIIVFPAFMGLVSNGNNIDKYEANSDYGHATVSIRNGVDSLLVGAYSGPSTALFLVIGIILLIVVVMVMYKMNTRRNKS
jgi:hypothetical protein